MEIKTSDRGFKRVEQKLESGFTLAFIESSRVGWPAFHYGVKEEAIKNECGKPVRLPFSVERHYILNNTLLIEGRWAEFLINSLEEGTGILSDPYHNSFEFKKIDGGVRITIIRPHLQYFDGPSGDGWQKVDSLVDHTIVTTWTLTDTEVKEHCDMVRTFITTNKIQ